MFSKRVEFTRFSLLRVLFCSITILIMGGGGVSAFGWIHRDNIADIDTLQLVQVLFRHGDRAATNSYPNDPLTKNSSLWPEGMSQLTSIGKMQQYNLGQYLRNRYDGFLAKKYKSDELYVMSSDMDRTIMSLESNLAGLFPPVHKWHPHLDWQPIPLRTIPWKEDRYLHMNTKCPKYDKIHRDFIQNSEVAKALNEENRDFVKFLSEQSGIRANTVKEIIVLQDIILTEWTHNMSIPQWALDSLPRLNELQTKVNTWSTFTEEMKRLRGGPLLDLLIKNMLAKSGKLRFTAPNEEKRIVVGGGNRKIVMYSAHDSTLVRIMNTIGVFHPHNVPYASALMLELHWDKQKEIHFIRIFYRNDTNVPPYELQLPNCETPCPLNKMIELTKHLIPLDLTEECQLAADLLKSGSIKDLTSNTNIPPTCITYTYPEPLIIGLIVALIFTIFILTCFCITRLNQCAEAPMRKFYPHGRFTYERL